MAAKLCARVPWAAVPVLAAGLLLASVAPAAFSAVHEEERQEAAAKLVFQRQKDQVGPERLRADVARDRAARNKTVARALEMPPPGLDAVTAPETRNGAGLASPSPLRYKAVLFLFFAGAVLTGTGYCLRGRRPVRHCQPSP